MSLRSAFPRFSLLMLTCLSLAACNNEAPVASAPTSPEVGVLTIEPRAIELSSELPGRTSAYLVAEVRPQVSGILLQRAFQEGSDVKAEQTLYQIDPAPYRATLARAEASLESAGLLARRYEQLIQAHAISQQQYDDARSQFLQAKAAVESARIAVGYTRIAAPISGRVGRSTVTQGALVTANQVEALATVQQLDPIYVDIVQPSSALLELREDLASGRLKSAGNGQAEVRLKLENGRDFPHAGKLQFSEVSVDQSTGAVTLRAVFPNPEEVLLPGMFVRAQLRQGVHEQAILIPQRAVTRDSQGRAVALILDNQDTVHQRTLVTERSVEGQWLVSNGLQPGDRVIVEGLQHVRLGMQVKPVEANGVSSVVAVQALGE
ncbi:MAG: efflux RND transporter periplasmic adaptor subunit [Pseudomonas sp.]